MDRRGGLGDTTAHEHGLRPLLVYLFSMEQEAMSDSGSLHGQYTN